MSVSAYEHHEFMEFLKEQWGPRMAETMMNLLPVVGWSEVATKRDVADLETHLSIRMDGLGTELRGELNEFRGELSELRGELRGEMGAMEARLSSQNSSNLRLLFLGMIGSNATLAGLVLAAVRLV